MEISPDREPVLSPPTFIAAHVRVDPKSSRIVVVVVVVVQEEFHFTQRRRLAVAIRSRVADVEAQRVRPRRAHAGLRILNTADIASRLVCVIDTARSSPEHHFTRWARVCFDVVQI